MRNLKKVVALIAVFAMMVSTVAFAATFSDVAEGHDYFEAIEMLSKLDILTGDDQDGDGVMDFRPEDTITRAEVAAVVSRIQGIVSASQASTEFVDVPQTHWASGYVAQAAGQGIVNGYGDGNFGPEDPVLYEQAIKMLVETLGYAPFVADNGGYYAGHLTAASRYGVLDGVVGGAVGTPATRGQVAQMVYNAIDTPIMDRYTYGKDAEYVVYDGKNGRDYMTLLTRDLGVKKFTGLLVESEISEGGTIDTEDDAEITVSVVPDQAYINYDMQDITGMTYTLPDTDTTEDVVVLVGEESAVDLIGMNVNVLAKKVKNSTDYEVVSIAPASTNRVVEFTLDQFAGADDDTDEVSYYANESDRKATVLEVEDGAFDFAYYNGVELGENLTAEAAFSYASVVVDGTDSGKVTLIDNNSEKGYDVVCFEVAATAVVDEVSANGVVEFKEDAVNSKGDSVNGLVFDEDNDEQIINLTKDGAAIEYTELTEWDVLSILYNEAIEYYRVAVLDSTVVEGEVTQKTASKTSEGGYKFKIAGNSYDVAKNCYNGDKIEIGAAGMFYIDAYGKIVAYDKTGSKSVSDNYAFVIGAEDVENSFKETTIAIQILDKTGALQRGTLAERVKIVNSAVATGDLNDLYDIEADLTKEEIANLADELKNAFITFDVNAKGEIDEIEFPYADPDDGLYLSYDGTAGMRYDEEDRELGNYDLDDDTVIFYINAKDGSMLTPGAVASTTKSTVGAVAALATNSAVKCMVYDAEEDKVPGAVVIFDQNAGISPSTNVAVIDEVGSAYVDGEEVVSVSYYMNGELQNAVTYEELSNADDVAAADQGDIWKFSVTEGVITAAEALVTYDRYTKVVDDEIVESLVANDAEGGAATFAINEAFDGGVRGDEVIYAGAVVDYKSSNKKFALDGAGSFNAGEETNVYVLDPSLRNNKLKVGTASSVNVDEDLLEDRPASSVVKLRAFEGGDVLVAADEEPLGMLDYAVAYEYDGDVLDIVIYKAYDFGKYEVVVPR